MLASITDKSYFSPVNFKFNLKIQIGFILNSLEEIMSSKLELIDEFLLNDVTNSIKVEQGVGFL